MSVYRWESGELGLKSLWSGKREPGLMLSLGGSCSNTGAGLEVIERSVGKDVG